MIKELKDTNEKYLLEIFDAVEQIDSLDGMNSSQLIVCMLEMTTESVKRIKTKIIASSEPMTEEMRERIAEGYLSMLNESKNTILRKYSHDTSKSKYSLTDFDIRTLTRYFINILKDKFSNSLLVELFISNFMVYSFGAMINACEHKQLVEMEKEKRKGNRN